MSSKLPRVAVLMSVYGNEQPEFLRAAITSIRDQSYPAVDLHQFLDGPLPEPLAGVVRELQQSCDRMHVYAHPDRRGLAVCLNDLLDRTCDGHEYFARMDSDEVSHKDRIELQVQFLNANPEIDLVGTWTIDIDASGREIMRVRYPLTHDKLVQFFAKRTLVAHGSVMFRRRFLELAGRYPAVSTVEDELYWMQAIQAGCRFAVIPEYLVYGRHTEQFWRRRSELRRAWLEFKTRATIIRTLHFGAMAWLYAVGLVAVNLAPVSVKRLLYRYLR